MDDKQNKQNKQADTAKRSERSDEAARPVSEANERATPAAQEPTPTTPKKEPAFSLERLEKDCYQLFGVTPSTFAGATCKVPKDKTFTVAEMKKFLEDWGNTPVFSRDRKARKEGK